jgi:hypothetical protein
MKAVTTTIALIFIAVSMAAAAGSPSVKSSFPKISNTTTQVLT